jgi:pimeloyl-ACP methyl ester carboxylesterase
LAGHYDRPMPDRLRNFTHDGLLFDVLDDGPRAGDVVIALHGFPQLSSCWDAVTPVLTAAGYRVLAPDQRGYSPGARPRRPAAYRLDRLAGDVLALADAAGAQRFHVLGHDWGGGVAWYLASRHRDRVRTLSVVSTPHPRALIKAMLGRQLARAWYMAPFQLPGLPEYLLRARGGALPRKLLARSGMRAERRVESAKLLAEPGAATGALNWYRGMRSRGVTGPGKITVPTLYVWSDADTAFGRAAATGTARWVTGPYRFEVLEGVSHWIPDERPVQLGRLVVAHLRTHTDDT